jgi:anaerobic magnesium-protoporphyrin IX monomethyl ester cyclase
MRLLLVMPTGLKVGYDGYFSSSPLGIETIAAHAGKVADVALADMRGKGGDVQAHAEELLNRGQADIIGISLNSAPHANYTMALAGAIRQRSKDVRIIAGGQQATFMSDELLATGNIDAVVRGEGEFAITEILQRNQFGGVAGVSWMDGGVIRHEQDRPLIENLDDILMPARHLLPNRNRYRMGKYRIEGIEASRGCPYQCSFCSIRNFHRGRWRPKSVARVMQEVDHILANYPEEKVIYFADDNFANDIKRVEEICRAIVERKTGAYFWCQARADRIAAHPEVVEWMGKAHFAAVLMGIETPVDRLLKSAKKGGSHESVGKAIEMLHEQDIGVWGTFTMGLPSETAAEAKLTADYIPTANVDVAQITVATPIPGSTLYNDAKAAGDLLTTNWDDYDFTAPTMKGQLPRAELDKLMRTAYRKVYLGLGFLTSILSERTNIGRLRRTAFGVFWSWIWFLLKEQFVSMFKRKGWTKANK